MRPGSLFALPVYNDESRFVLRKSKIRIFKDSLNAFINLFKIAFSVYGMSNTHSLFLAISLLIYVAIFYKLMLAFPLFSTVKPVLLSLPNKDIISFIIAATLNYLFIFFLFSRDFGRNFKKIHVVSVVVSFATVCLFALFTYPIFSQDQSWNMLMSKAYLTYGKNPYTTSVSDIQSDSWALHAPAWTGVKMVYGPISVLVYSIAPALTNDFYVALLLTKVISFVALLACMYLAYSLYKTAGLLDSQIKNTLMLLILNPFFVINAVITAHNDIFICLVILIFTLSLIKKKYLLCMLVLILGILVKYVPIILCPALLVYLIREERLVVSKKITLMFWGGLLSLLLTAFLYGLFIQGCSSLKCFTHGIIESNNLGNNITGLFPSVVLHNFGISNTALKLLFFFVSILVSVIFATKNRVLESIYYPLVIPVLFSAVWFEPWYFLWSYFLIAPKIKIKYLAGLASLLILTTCTFSPFLVSLALFLGYLSFYFVFCTMAIIKHYGAGLKDPLV